MKELRRLRLLALFALLTGCPYPSYELPDAGFPTELPADATPISEDELASYQACAAHGDTFPEDTLVSVTATLSDRSDGATDTVVSAGGCVHFLRVMEGGEVTSAAFRLYTGEILYAVGDEVTYGARFIDFARWERDAAGALVGTIDLDDDLYDATDDFREVATIEREGYYRVSRFNPSSRDLEWQLTQDASSGARVQTTEELVGGTLTVIDRTSLDVESELGGAPTASECLSSLSTCDVATTARLDASLARALARGSNCMAGLDLPESSYASDVWQRLQALKNLWTRGHGWSCMPAGCTFGHWCEHCGTGGVDQIDIGFAEWSALPENMQLGVLFHEFMHGVIGGHLDVIVNSDIESPTDRRGRLMRRYVDPVDACEAYCFSAAPTRCSCATCLGRRTCDEPCAGLASCREDDCTGPGGCVPIMSEAVGAACVTTNAAGEESAVWSATMADCMSSGCGASGGTCRSYNRSCETGCE